MGALNGRGVRVELDGGAMQVRFDMNRLIDIEDHFGDLSGLELALTTKPFRTVRWVMFTAGTWLGDADRAPVTEEAVGAVIDPARLGKVSEAVGRALREALGLGDVEVAPSDPTGAVAATRSPS